MASTERIFFAGVATTVLLIGAGFGGGVLLGKTAMAPTPEAKMAQARVESKAAPRVRVVLPAVSETPQTAPTPSPVSPVQAAIPTPLEPLTQSQPEPQVIPAKDIQKQDTAKEKQGERQAEAEKQKKAVERERRHKRYAEKKARQEAAREQQQQLQQAQLQQQHEREMHGQARPFGIVAFDDGDEPAAKSGFYGD